MQEDFDPADLPPELRGLLEMMRSRNRDFSGDVGNKHRTKEDLKARLKRDRLEHRMNPKIIPERIESKTRFDIGTRVVVSKAKEDSMNFPKGDDYGIIVATFDSLQWTPEKATSPNDYYDCIVARYIGIESHVALYSFMSKDLREIPINELGAINYDLDSYRLPPPRKFNKGQKVHIDVDSSSMKIFPACGNYGVVLDIFEQPIFVKAKGDVRNYCDMVVACVVKNGMTEPFYFHSSELIPFTPEDESRAMEMF